MTDTLTTRSPNPGAVADRVIDDLGLAQRIVRDALSVGIAVHYVNVSGAGIGLHPLEPRLAPALALHLALPTRSVLSGNDRTFETFEGHVDGRPVTVFGADVEAVAL